MNPIHTETLHSIDAVKRLKGIVKKTPLTYHAALSQKYNCRVYLKREDLQITRSYKLRGAYNMISGLSKKQLEKGIVCASAGNHAQGFAYSCNLLGVKGIVFMPESTPGQKVNQTKMFGRDQVRIVLKGNTFDDCAAGAKIYAKAHHFIFIPPFDDLRIIEGQGTVAVELLEQLSAIDFLFVPVGGGGLAAGIGAHFSTESPHTKIIGAEPEGAPSMKKALAEGMPVILEHIDGFVDGAAVRRVGDITFPICRQVLEDMITIPEGKICSVILKLYNEDAIVTEPAGALSVAALDHYAAAIEGKTVVCIISGSNNDMERMQEIKERSLLYEGLKHYFLIRFAQKPGALKEFVNKVLGPEDDIIRFEFMKKNIREFGPALIGIELKNKNDYDTLLLKMDRFHLDYTLINQDDALFGYLV